MICQKINTKDNILYFYKDSINIFSIYELGNKKRWKKYYIIRTSGVFGEYGKNFVYTIQRLDKDRDKLTIVAD